MDPNSFHYISRSPVSILEFFKALLNGLKKQSSMILSVIVICSCFRVVNDTKALSNFFTAALNKLQHRAILLIPVILTFGTFGLFVWGAITLDWGTGYDGGHDADGRHCLRIPVRNERR